MKLFLLTLLFSLPALAYIPTSQFVFNRVAELHGNGSYKLHLDVTFKEGAETQTIKEIWTIGDSSEMFVVAYGDNFKLAKLNKKGRAYWIEQTTGERSFESSQEIYMPILFQKSSTELKRIFVRWGALHPDALKDKKPLKELVDIKNETEPFVRLGRVNGAVQYYYGEPDKAGVWIAQDLFFISKMRMASGAEFWGQDYATYSKSLAFPKTHLITFGTAKVEIKVTSLVSIELSKEDKLKLEPSGMRNKPDYVTSWPSSALTNTIQEFYKRFR